MMRQKGIAIITRCVASRCGIRMINAKDEQGLRTLTMDRSSGALTLHAYVGRAAQVEPLHAHHLVQ